MKLSILICSLKERAEKFDRLIKLLAQQFNSEAEVRWEIDNGEKSIGKKRNELLARAIGDYVAFVDDDDLVSNDYIEKILKAIESEPDCCSLTGEISFSCGRKRTFIHSIENGWELRGDIYYRYPNHLNTIKRELALQVGFPELNHGEDKEFADRIKPLLKTESKIEGIIYYYLARYAA